MPDNDKIDREKIARVRRQQVLRDAQGREHRKPQPPPGVIIEKGAWSFREVKLGGDGKPVRKTG